NRNNELLFAAHIDNYFGETDLLNPLYLTTFYYTLFDESTETFERDPVLPNDDLFRPDVSQIPLFKIVTDSSVIKKMDTLKLMKQVRTEIYVKNLAPKEFFAPSTAFSAQPFTID